MSDSSQGSLANTSGQTGGLGGLNLKAASIESGTSEDRKSLRSLEDDLVFQDSGVHDTRSLNDQEDGESGSISF